MANPKRTNSAPLEPIAALPIPDNPQHPVVKYMQDKLGAEFQLSPNYGLRGLPDIPKNRGNADLFNALANLPIEQGGLVGSNLEARPELFLGDKKLGRMMVALPDVLEREGADMGGATGTTHIENPPRVYVDPTPLKGEWSGNMGRKVNPFLTIAHEMNHANNLNAGYKPKPENSSRGYIARPTTRAAVNFYAQDKHDKDRFSQDSYSLGWPSTTDPNKSFTNNNFEEAIASAAGIEATLPRGKLPWDNAGGAKLFNTPARQGAYVEATRSGKEPLAVSDEGYNYPERRWQENWDEVVRRGYNSRGLGGYSALMNTRPINQVVADWFR